MITAGWALGALVLASSACGSGDPGLTATSASPATAAPPGTAQALTEPVTGTEVPGPDRVGAAATTTAPAPVTPEAPAPTEAPTPPPTTGAPAGTVLTADLDLTDPSRPTTAGGRTIAPDRSLPTVVTYPSGPGPFPLLVFAHGFRLGPAGYTRVIDALAAAGYVVAAPTFPLADGPDADRADIPNQSGDLSYVIDGVLAASADPTSPLAGRVDGSRIGAVGHSDGADTVLDLGYHPDRVDPRVRAVVALSPDASAPPFGGVGSATPLLLEHGDADTVVPYGESSSVFAAVTARRYFLTLLGAGHLEPVARSTVWTPVLDATASAFLARFVAGDGTTEEAIVGPARASERARIEVAG